MDGAAVRTYVERAQSILETSQSLDEATTKASLIRPFIELLGWAVEPGEVKLDYRVTVGDREGIVDYCLEVDGEPAVFVIVSATTREIADEDVDRFRQFLRGDLPVDRVVLTNGVSYEVLVKRSSGEIARIGFDLEDLSSRPNLPTIVEKEALVSGRADRMVADVAGPETDAIVETLKDRKVTIARRIGEVLKDEVGTTKGLELSARSGQFVEALIDDLEAGPNRGAVDSAVSANGGPEQVAGWTPEPDADARAGTIRRRDLDGRNAAGVAVLAMPESGQQFLIENNAWGTVHVGDPPTYVAMYVRGDVREVRYVARVHDIVSPDAAPLARSVSAYEDDVKIHNWKKLIRFEPDSLYELEDPIPYDSRYPLGVQMTTLKQFRSATTTDDLF